MRPGTALISLCAITLVAMSGYLWLKSAELEEVPDITVVTTSGERIALAGMRGKPLLVTFWATTCPSCMKEMPLLIDLYHELSPLGLKVIGIAMYYDPPNRVLAMQASRSIPYTIALDIDARAARAFGDVELTPTTFLIAPDGRVVYQKTGGMDMDRLRNDILAMLRSSPTSPPVSAGVHS
ncbi:MAG: TlpA disulfide reductase family protein [Gammaproteobacteria bacterium]